MDNKSDKKIGLKIEQNRTKNWTRKIRQKLWTVNIRQEIEQNVEEKSDMGHWTVDMRDRKSDIRHRHKKKSDNKSNKKSYKILNKKISQKSGQKKSDEK